jgi:hypothetical protein
MKKGWQLRRTEGQSLVELALTFPILVLMFAGLFEVGAALRNYLVVVNANREGARFAARGTWYDTAEIPTFEDAQIIFARVIAAGGTEGRDENVVQFLRLADVDDQSANTTIAVTYIEVPPQVDDSCAPDLQGPSIHGPWYMGIGGHQSQVDAAARAIQAQQNNLAFNLEYCGQLDVPNADNFAIVEIWFDHEQLLGLPIFTEILPRRFTLYSQSTMRVTLGTRIE